MKRRIFGCLLLAVMIPAVALAAAVNVSSTDLIENALSLDGQTVIYTGEAIGDLMPRGDHAWVNLSDGSNAIGIWIDADMLGKVSILGRYGQVGNELQVTGVFHRACQEHGGDMDIHAEQITVQQNGYAVESTVSGWKMILTVVFTVLDVAILILYLKKANKRGVR